MTPTMALTFLEAVDGRGLGFARMLRASDEDACRAATRFPMVAMDVRLVSEPVALPSSAVIICIFLFGIVAKRDCVECLGGCRREISWNSSSLFVCRRILRLRARLIR